MCPDSERGRDGWRWEKREKRIQRIQVKDAGNYEKTLYGKKRVIVNKERRAELNLLSANSFCCNSSYRLLNVGYMPVTLFSTFNAFCQVILISTL